MIIGLDTSGPVCQIYIASADDTTHLDWDIGRGLADNIIPYIRECLRERDAGWEDLTGIVVRKGPGSFTGLRIGLTVMNTVADSRSIPIVGGTGEEWFSEGLARLRSGDNDRMVLPEYGREPDITKPRK